MTRTPRIAGALLAFFLLLAAGGLVLPARAGGTPTPTTGLPSRAGTSAVMPFVIELPPGAWALVPLDGQAVPDGEWTYDGEGGQYSVSFWQWITPGATATPTPYATDTPSQPPPTATPTATLTPSPAPTAAETATFTPTPTDMPSPTTTATPALPTATPAPTQEVRLFCIGTPLAGYRYRADPGLSGAVLGTFSSSTIQTLAFEARRVISGDAWYAFWYEPGVYAWLREDGITFTMDTGCAQLPEDPPKTAWGVLTTVGADKATVAEMIDIVQGAGHEPALVVVMDASMAAAFNDSAYVIWRPWPDCPSFDATPADSVRARLDYIDAVTRFWDFDALQITNECLFPSPQYLNLWTLEALRQGRARYPGKTIIPWVFAPGVFEPSWVPVLHDALADMAAHHDMAGLNLYPARAGVPLSTRDAWTVWTTWRYELIEAAMTPDASPCWAITEAGAGDGNMALTPGDAAAFARQIDGDVCVVAFWHLSPPGGAWPDANLWDRASVVFSAVVEGLHAR